jgi:hypothetical protein
MDDVLVRAAARRRTALHILSDLELLERWAPYGRAVLVGAVAYGLVVSPDIDLEIYSRELRIEHGFAVLGGCALHPRVTHARFANHLLDRDQALYWQLRYRHEDGIVWTVDMWSAAEDYALPRAEHLVGPLRDVLCPETRAAILRLKEYRASDKTLECPSIDLYRAVIDDGVRTVEGLRRWLSDHRTGELVDWKPKGRKETP